MECFVHSSVPASRRCVRCDRLWCDHCIIEHEVANVKMCPECRDMAVPIGRRAVERDGSFFQDLPGALTYPFHNGGWITLVAAAVFIIAMDFIAAFSCFGFIAVALGTGYMLNYLMRIVSDSADGNDELPDWPDFTNWWDDVVLPIVQAYFVLTVCIGPAVGLAIAQMKGPAIIAGVVGALYFPMAWTALALDRSVVSTNPVNVLSSIARVPFQYFIATVAFGLVVGTGTWVSAALDATIIGSLVGYFVTLYFLFVSMRILGRLYFRNEHVLAWYGEDQH